MAKAKRTVEAITSEMHAKGWRVGEDGAFHAPADPGPGHNSDDAVEPNQLKSLVTRIERLNEEKATLSSDIREVYGEAKSHGYDPRILRKVIALRARDLSERQEEEAQIDLYLQAVGHKS